jgi:fatty acid desaturase
MSAAELSSLESHPAGVHRKAVLRALHQNAISHLLEHNLVSYAWVALVAAAIWTWFAGLWPLTVVIWLIGAHMGHMKLAAFHEASHGTLHTTGWRNDMQGMLVGTVMFIPLSVYRLAHWQHHAYLASEKDPELWPFNKPGTPRWLRVLAAVAEIVLGFVYTPLLFLRAVWIARDISPRQRVRIGVEYGLCVALWATVLSVVWLNDWWEAFLVGYGVQMVLTGALQTINKYTEHLGLLGDTALTSTRTVVDEQHPGRALSRSMLNIDYHGTHHRYAKVPFYHLPAATPIVYGDGDPAEPIYSTYAAAMWDTLKCLGDPKVGRQWLAAEPN